ncbi:MAG: hypothetical protein C0467_06930 [Planctomycetaceae bacterium]|nr:hypothetical protein [Planctomycetaceae bacterium]
MEYELGGDFSDQRLKARLGTLLGDLSQRIGGTLPMACHDWTETKADYRSFSNRESMRGIVLAGNFAAITRFGETSGTVLALHDTIEFKFQRNTPLARAGCLPTDCSGWFSSYRHRD